MLAAGLEVVHAHGYAGASVRDIVNMTAIAVVDAQIGGKPL